ncbi:MAG TPA: UDP-N-acetylmuramoyl-L-alanine--D-glutamate ligase [Mycobacteriales bacterium]|nr:UDP-N-acetylmuramoyl-L-alanine--D-glutamate ligase [Mycobacteriales bacterium]
MSAWAGRRVVVAGAGASGEAAAKALLALGARITVVDARGSDRTAALAAAGAALALGADTPPAGTELIVASPGWRPDSPLLTAGVPVIGEVELAWRLRGPGPAPCLALTGTNGKTTTVRMLESMLRAAGERTVATGNVGLPVVDAVLAQPPYGVLAVELSSFQLHSAPSVRPAAAALLNLAPDHLDWHGGFEAYAAAKELIWAGAETVAIGNDDDPEVATRLAKAPGRQVSFTLAAPGPDQLGVVDGVLTDRAFGGGPLAPAAEVRPAGPHNAANALAAAALARAHGVPPAAIRAGLRDFVPDRHRNERVADVGGVTYVDDSKATNPHAAAASLTSYEPVVWIAGGLLKGAPVDELVAQVAPRLAGAVLLGADRADLAAAIARHAPSLPVVTVSRTDDGAMSEVVRAAAGLARAGDTVLLAPAAASMDMFRDYGARGDAFAAAVRALTGP